MTRTVRFELVRRGAATRISRPICLTCDREVDSPRDARDAQARICHCMSRPRL